MGRHGKRKKHTNVMTAESKRARLVNRADISPPSSSLSSHSLEGMVNIRTSKCESKKCKFIEFGVRCSTWPCFNMPTEYVGKFCNQHKLQGMVDVHAIP
jgi:hypothetical protein